MPHVFRLLLALAIVAAAPYGAGSAAAQQGVAIATTTGTCLRPVEDQAGAELRTGECRNAGLFRVVQGSIRTPAGWCLDWVNEGGPVHLAACRADRRSQRWELLESRAVRNGLRADLCMDVEGGEPGAGARVLAWRCHNAGAPPANQRFRLVGKTP